MATKTKARTSNDIRAIIARVKFRDWEFVLEERPGGTLLLHVEFGDPDDPYKGRKWHVSPWATPGEIVQTCLLAVLTALEHEAREAFLYQGEPVFGPHHDIEALLGIAQQKRWPK